MYEKSIIVKSPCDIYRFQARALNYTAKNTGTIVKVQKLSNAQEVNASSLLSVLTLGVKKGDMIQLTSIGKPIDLISLLNSMDRVKEYC